MSSVPPVAEFIKIILDMQSAIVVISAFEKSSSMRDSQAQASHLGVQFFLGHNRHVDLVAKAAKTVMSS